MAIALKRMAAFLKIATLAAVATVFGPIGIALLATSVCAALLLFACTVMFLTAVVGLATLVASPALACTMDECDL